MHLESCLILTNDAERRTNNLEHCQTHLGATVRTPDVQQTQNKCSTNTGRVHDVCIGQSMGMPRVYKAKFVGTLCLHIPVLLPVLAAVAAAAAITFPH